MPKIKARILSSEIKDKRFIVTIQCNNKMPKQGEIVTIKWGSARSVQQNKLYWLFLEWILEHGGLKDEYLSTDELHECLKGRFLAKRIKTNFGFETLKIGSTTELDKTAFAEYINKIDKAVVEYCKVDTSGFWEEYKDMYSRF